MPMVRQIIREKQLSIEEAQKKKESEARQVEFKKLISEARWVEMRQKADNMSNYQEETM